MSFIVFNRFGCLHLAFKKFILHPVIFENMDKFSRCDFQGQKSEIFQAK